MLSNTEEWPGGVARGLVLADLVGGPRFFPDNGCGGECGSREAISK